MNTNLCNIVKHIAANYGEDVLTDPKRLKAFLADLARDESKAHKNALIKCLEYGFAQTLKSASGEYRVACVQRLAQKLR